MTRYNRFVNQFWSSIAKINNKITLFFTVLQLYSKLFLKIINITNIERFFMKSRITKILFISLLFSTKMSPVAEMEKVVKDNPLTQQNSLEKEIKELISSFTNPLKFFRNANERERDGHPTFMVASNISKPTLLCAKIKNFTKIKKFLKKYEDSNKDKNETVEVLLEAQADVNGAELLSKSALLWGKIEIKKFTEIEIFLKKYSASFSNVANKELVITIKSIKNKEI